MNVPAVFIVLAVAALLISGVRKSTRTNTIMVFVKSGILLLFIALAFTAFNSRQPVAVLPRRPRAA